MRINNSYFTTQKFVKGLIRIAPLVLLFVFISVACSKQVMTSIGLANKHSTEQVAEKHVIDPTTVYDSLLRTSKAPLFDSIMDRAYHKWGFHGVILVAKDGKLIYETAVGSADFKKHRRQVTVDDVFQLASVSKQFTAMSIMMLAEQGKLGYDDTITKYIPELPYKDVTIRQCLNHTGGFPNYMWLVEHKWDKERAPSNEEVIAMMAEYKLPPYFSPGRRFDYSNTGYMVLATIVQRISGKPFADYVQDNIFTPLGMEHSYVYSAATDDSMPGTVDGYIHKWRRYRVAGEDPNNGCVGDKNVFSTAADLLRWDNALNNNTLISDSTMALAFTHGETRRHRSINYGFGYRLKETNGIKYAYHHGLWNGFRTAFVKDLTNGYTYILLNNTSTSVKTKLLDRLEDIALQDVPELEQQVTAALNVMQQDQKYPL